MDDTFVKSAERRSLSDLARYAKLDILRREPAPLHPTARAERVVSAAQQRTGVLRANREWPLEIDLRLILAHFRRNLALIALFGAAGVIVATFYGVMAPSRFTTTSEILIDPLNLQVVSDDLYSRNEQRDALVLNVESKMRLLTSTNVLHSVVEELDLASDPEFAPRQSWVGLPWSSSPPLNSSETNAELIALRSLAEGVRVRRDERSFVVTLAATAGNPEKAVIIARSIISAFRKELAEADAEGAGRAAAELTGRITELKSQVTEAEAAVERFRSLHGLQASQGELVSSLSMSQINTQMIAARERLIEARSRYEELSGSAPEALLAAAAQNSPTLTALQAQHATTRQQADSLSQTLGPRHPKYTAILPQLATIERQIAAETSRIVEAARSELQQAEAVAASLAMEADTAQTVVADGNAAQVQLRELERNAAAQAAIYEAFLSRAEQIAEREQIDTTNVRVISEPLPPRVRSWPPRPIQLVILGFVAGLALGSFAALATLLLRPRSAHQH